MTLSGISEWLHYCAKAKGLKSSDLWIQALCSSRARFLRASFSSHRICWSHGTCDEACRRIWCCQGWAFLMNNLMHDTKESICSSICAYFGQSVSVEMILVCQANVSVYLVLCSTLLEQWLSSYSCEFNFPATLMQNEQIRADCTRLLKQLKCKGVSESIFFIHSWANME